MRKLLFAFIAFCAVSFASCGNSTKSAEGVDSVDTTVVDSLVADTVVADSIAE